MSKLEKLRNRLSGEKDEVDQFLYILRLDDDVMSISRGLQTKEMKGDKSVLGSDVKTGDEFYFSMTTEKKSAGEISIKLNKVIKSEFSKYMLDPTKYLMHIVVIDHQNMTYRIDRSRVSHNGCPLIIPKMTRKEVEDSVEFEWFKQLMTRFKKQK
jgi:hypothetical protein